MRTLLVVVLAAASAFVPACTAQTNTEQPKSAQNSAANSARLKLPAGFHISVFAHTHGPRMLVWSPGGVLLASNSDAGNVVALPDPQHTGKAARVVTILSGLRRPHGLAFHEAKLYVASEDAVVSYDWDEAHLRATNPHRITILPAGGHSTRTILFAPNGKLYVSIGSSCNLCVEKDQRRAAVLEMNPDGSGARVFARGLRNAVGLVWNDATKSVWATDNGRDMMGDDVPPDEVDDLGSNGGDFGWPYCYDDRKPDPKYNDAARCANTIPPKLELQAHSAPLGLAFYTGNKWPQEYRGDLFVAYHGSWNRTIPTGYKVVRIHEANGKPAVTDFLTGFLPAGARNHDGLIGRPVDVLFAADGGTLYVTDDEDGYVYRVNYGK